jgi:hypothetical protein
MPNKLHVNYDQRELTVPLRLQMSAGLGADVNPDPMHMVMEANGKLRGMGAPVMVISRRTTLDPDTNTNNPGTTDIQTVVWQHQPGGVNPHDIEACEDLLDTYYTQVRSPPASLLCPS